MELLVVLTSWLVFGGAASYFASQRGRDPMAWFLIGMLLGILALLLLFLLPSLPTLESESLSSEHVELPKAQETLCDWFYLDAARNQIGPTSFEVLQKEWKEGRISLQTYVWCEGMENWQKINQLPTLTEELQKAVLEPRS